MGVFDDIKGLLEKAGIKDEPAPEPPKTYTQAEYDAALAKAVEDAKTPPPVTFTQEQLDAAIAEATKGTETPPANPPAGTPPAGGIKEGATAAPPAGGSGAPEPSKGVDAFSQLERGELSQADFDKYRESGELAKDWRKIIAP